MHKCKILEKALINDFTKDFNKWSLWGKFQNFVSDQLNKCTFEKRRKEIFIDINTNKNALANLFALIQNYNINTNEKPTVS